MIGASFDSTKSPLRDLLARADAGSLRLPDFQRGWVWAGVVPERYDEGPEEWDAEEPLEEVAS